MKMRTKNFKLLLILFAIILFFFGWAVLLHSFYIIEDVKVLEADVYISDGKVGFNLDKDMVHFGIVPIGKSSSVRTLILRNNRSYPVDVVVTGKGKFKTWLFSYEEGNPLLMGPQYHFSPNEEKRIQFGVIPGNEAKVGEQYFGKILVITKKKWFW